MRHGMRTLGELEARVMRVMWRASTPMTVRDTLAELAPEREFAYTTVMTILDRLWRKKFLERTMRGRAYEYRAVVSEAEYTAELMHQLLAGASDRRAALAHFVGGMKAPDEEELRRLADEASKRKRPT